MACPCLMGKLMMVHTDLALAEAGIQKSSSGPAFAVYPPWSLCILIVLSGSSLARCILISFPMSSTPKICMRGRH